MNLKRTPLQLFEQQPVPVDWPRRVGLPAPGMMRKTAYPAGQDVDDEYPCSEDGKKLAKAHAWQFPNKYVKVCDKTLSY